MIEMSHPPLSYNVCPRCEQAMAPGTSCDDSPWPQPDGGHVHAIVFGAERNFDYEGENCWDCGAPRGGTHHYGCCWEECPHGNQAVNCDECPVLENDPFYRETSAN